MSNELMRLCADYGFVDGFREMIGGMEHEYNKICILEQGLDGEQLTMVEWINENTKIAELNCLSDKEKFLYALGILSCEIINY